jgi:hypothetical protein
MYARPYSLADARSLVVEARYFFRCLLHLDFAIFGLQSVESTGAVRISLVPGIHRVAAVADMTDDGEFIMSVGSTPNPGTHGTCNADLGERIQIAPMPNTANTANTR